jgi:hypothetical protein
VLFSSGGQAANQNTFVGVGSTSAQEEDVLQILNSSGSATSIRCWIATAPNATQTYTVRVNQNNTTLTCTIASGQNKGSGTGSASWVAGDVIDIQVANGSGANKPVSFAIN